jgi:hypothetical protein
MDADSLLDYWLGECVWLGMMIRPGALSALLTKQVALVATGGLLGSQLILGVISLMNPVSVLATPPVMLD